MNPNVPEPTPTQALELLAQAAIQFRGTLQEHQTLQSAVKVLDELVNPKTSEEPTEKVAKKK